MDKGKGIAPGCLVMLIKANLQENVGKIGTAVNIYTENAPEGRLWTVRFDQPIQATFNLINTNERVSTGSPEACDYCHHPEGWLRRIDGDPDDIFGESDIMKPTKTVGERMDELANQFRVPA